MLDFDQDPIIGALCWTDQNDYLICPKDYFFDFILETEESILEVQKIMYIPPSDDIIDYAVLIRDKTIFAFPATDNNMDFYRRSIWVNHPNVTINYALLIADPFKKIYRL